MKNKTCFHSNRLIFICLVHNIWQKPLKMSKKSYLTLIFKSNMISQDLNIFHNINQMDLHMEPNDGLSFKIVPSITLVIGVYFSRVCHWGPCISLIPCLNMILSSFCFFIRILIKRVIQIAVWRYFGIFSCFWHFQFEWLFFITPIFYLTCFKPLTFTIIATFAIFLYHLVSLSALTSLPQFLSNWQVNGHGCSLFAFIGIVGKKCWL